MIKINAFKRFHTIITEKKDGNFNQNRQKAINYLKKNGIKKNFFHLYLEGRDKIVRIKEKKITYIKPQTSLQAPNLLLITPLIKKSEFIKKTDLLADAIITDNPNHCLSMMVGDCFPVALVDQKNQTFALVHGGWEPLYRDILINTLQIMITDYHCQTENLKIWIGPGIRKCCYTFDEKPIQAQEEEWQPFVKTINLNQETGKFQQKNRPKKILQNSKKNFHAKEKIWQVDLAAYIKNQLTSFEIHEKQIKDYEQCTCCQKKKFFSYRRSMITQEKDGRFLVTLYRTSSASTLELL